VLCGRVRVFRHGPGLKYWRCSVAAQRDHGRHYRGALAGACERCGFVPEHICQLDIHHLDGDHLNNDPANLATLCANCHRLVENPDAAVAWRPG
jgi:5-methylcytosine-specific restriction endonuclease McrA